MKRRLVVRSARTTARNLFLNQQSAIGAKSEHVRKPVAGFLYLQLPRLLRGSGLPGHASGHVVHQGEATVKVRVHVHSHIKVKLVWSVEIHRGT
jgi:hypothetical protein